MQSWWILSVSIIHLLLGVSSAQQPPSAPTKKQVEDVRAALSVVDGVCAVLVNERTKVKVLHIVLPTSTDDKRLKLLPKIPCAFALSVADTEVTDTGLKELRGMSKLLWLHLSGTKITDAGLKELSSFTQLTSLSLARTAVTDAGLQELGSLRNLTELSLGETKVTDAGVRKLAKVLPKCKINR